MVHSHLDLESVTGAAVTLQASPRHSLNFYIWVYWYYLVYMYCAVHYIIKGKVGMFSKTFWCFLLCNLWIVCLAETLEYCFFVVILCLSLKYQIFCHFLHGLISIYWNRHAFIIEKQRWIIHHNSEALRFLKIFEQISSAVKCDWGKNLEMQKLKRLWQ